MTASGINNTTSQKKVRCCASLLETLRLVGARGIRMIKPILIRMTLTKMMLNQPIQTQLSLTRISLTTHGGNLLRI